MDGKGGDGKRREGKEEKIVYRLCVDAGVGVGKWLMVGTYISQNHTFDVVYTGF